uniref:hypothetical protein n=1 Tax=Methanohalobium sp. TaxID=2837493 RepID=UPI0025E55ED0
KSFAQAMEENFNDALTSAITRAFKRRVLMENLEPWIEDLTSAAEGGFTEDEIEDLRKSLKDLMGDLEGQWKEYQSLLEEVGLGGEEQQQSMKGAIKGVTEETAGLLAGRMHSIQMHVAEHVEIANLSLQTLRNIESNTLYNKKLYNYIKENELDVRAVGG